MLSWFAVNVTTLNERRPMLTRSSPKTRFAPIPMPASVNRTPTTRRPSLTAAASLWWVTQDGQAPRARYGTRGWRRTPTCYFVLDLFQTGD